VTGRIAWLSAQDAASAGRFLAAGLPPERLGPVVNLKSLAVPRPAPLPYPADRQRVILAASTHEGEEAAVIAALVAARATVPDLHLIIAPRHPRRREEIEAVLRGAGLTFSTRSRGELPDAARDVYLADTLGEMENWYSAAALTFVGGSLTDRGGHTPFEPAAHDSAIVAGPHVGNFREPYCALAADGACLTVHDQHDLAAALARMGEPSFVAGLAQRARVTMARLSSDGLADVLHQIEVLASLGSGGPRESLPGKGFTGR
jgi:3-deoxy-D-manno-octulosonic-acid transferase